MTSNSSSGGGIVRLGDSSGTGENDMRAFRRRWTSGVAIVTTPVDGGFRGVTVSGLLPLSMNPASLGFSLQEDSQFHEWMKPGALVGVSILDRRQEFVSERFAGRAPVPDAMLTGIPHRIEDGVALLEGALGWCVGTVGQTLGVGDHILVLVDVNRIDVGDDSDEPLVLYDSRYRDLEMS